MQENTLSALLSVQTLVDPVATGVQVNTDAVWPCEYRYHCNQNANLCCDKEVSTFAIKPSRGQKTILYAQID